MNAALLRALRVMARADSDPLRQELFDNLAASRASVRLARGLHARLGRRRASACLVASYGARTLAALGAPPGSPGDFLGVAVHANALGALRRASAWVAPARIDLVETQAAAGSLRPARVGRTLRVLQRIDRRGDFLVSCRAAATIACYARALAILRARRPRALFVSSDSNPEEVGFAAAARRLGVPTVFVSHAYTTPVSPPLDFDLAILEGEAALQAHRAHGPLRGAVALAGIEGDEASLDPPRLLRDAPVIGVFAPKAPVWPRLAALVEECRRLRPRRILVRWHPSRLDRRPVSRWLADTSSVEETDGREPLSPVAARCDWVIAATDSNVHLPVLKRGIPSLAVEGLSVCPPGRADLYGFVAGGVVFPAGPSIAALDREAAVAFYGPGWAERFRRYDAGYLTDGRALDEAVRAALARVLGRR